VRAVTGTALEPYEQKGLGMWVSLTKRSQNRKVGPIPVSTTEEASCPAECPLRGNGCYAAGGPLAIHWRNVKEGGRGDNWSAFCRRMREFPTGTPFRHNQAGDLPKNARGTIDRRKLRQLVAAVRHLRGWTYTHYDPTVDENAGAIARANRDGFVVNLSAADPAQADEYYKLGIGPVVTILPHDAPARGNKTPGGLPIVVCPAQTTEEITCADCMLCQKRDRKSIVGFLAHGISRKRISARIGRWER